LIGDCLTLGFSNECPNVVETPNPILGLNIPDAVPGKEAPFIHPFIYRIMFIFMLGLLLATAVLALKTVSNIKEMLVPVPVRAR
jgi:hypothetical protein